MKISVLSQFSWRKLFGAHAHICSIQWQSESTGHVHLLGLSAICIVVVGRCSIRISWPNGSKQMTNWGLGTQTWSHELEWVYKITRSFDAVSHCRGNFHPKIITHRNNILPFPYSVLRPLAKIVCFSCIADLRGSAAGIFGHFKGPQPRDQGCGQCPSLHS